MQTLIKLATQIPDKVKEENDRGRTILIGPAPFSAARYVNDARYCIGDRTLT